MNISLTPELEEFVQRTVKSGRYSSATEVIREALRLLEEHETTRASRLQDFRAEIDSRLASLDRGEGVDGEEFFSELRRKSAERRKKRA